MAQFTCFICDPHRVIPAPADERERAAVWRAHYAGEHPDGTPPGRGLTPTEYEVWRRKEGKP